MQVWGSALVGAIVRYCSRLLECCCATAYGTPYVVFNDSYLWALSPGGQRAHALVGGGIVPGTHVQGFGSALLGSLVLTLLNLAVELLI